MAKRANGIAMFSWDSVARRLQWDFGGALGVVGFTVPECGLDARDDAAMVFGYKQTIADAAAKSNATPAEKREGMADRIATLESGAWRAERGVSVDAILVAAIAAVAGKPLAHIREWLGTKTAEERAALAASPKFANEINRLRRERTAGIDAEALVGEISDL